MKKLLIDQILEGIRNHDNQVLTTIYKEIFPVVRYYVIHNGGNQDDAKDVFQESIIIAYKQISREYFELKSGFDSYLYGIARLVWLKILRNRSIHERNITKIEEPEFNYITLETTIEEELELRLFRKYFLKLKPECQTLLRLVSENIPYTEIALEMGYKSEKVVRNKKYKCKESLIRMIRSDPEFKNLRNREKNSGR